jgi:DNA-binding helix-hairpin-helix protein with protein kinase domain
LNNQKFKEYEIWYLAYVLIETGAKFHAEGKRVGDIRPLNIFINEDKQIKVATQYTWPHELTNYQKAKQNAEKTFLSPEEIMSLNIGYTEPIV